MNARHLEVVRLGLVIGSLTMCTSVAMADRGDSHGKSMHSSDHVVGLVKEVRMGTSMYKDVGLAESDGWGSAGNCVSAEDEGAMGIHYVNGPLLFDGAELDPRRPEALIYEVRNGRLKLVGVEFIVSAEEWDDAHQDGAAPVLMGQLFHYIGSPNRYRLPAVYALHVWAWKDNPSGTYVDWNPKVSCDEYEG